MSSSQTLKNKRAVVFGAGGSIGAAVAVSSPRCRSLPVRPHEVQSGGRSQPNRQTRRLGANRRRSSHPWIAE